MEENTVYTDSFIHWLSAFTEGTGQEMKNVN